MQLFPAGYAERYNELLNFWLSCYNNAQRERKMDIESERIELIKFMEKHTTESTLELVERANKIYENSQEQINYKITVCEDYNGNKRRYSKRDY
jgi:hypothetical protein